MKNPLIFCLVLCCFATYVIHAQTKPKLRRSEAFFGFHFDFHASKTDTIGTTFTAAMIDSMLTLTKPDYIQVDCKGHPGIASYPTKVGYQAAKYDKDVMRIWRDVTDKHNVPLFVHFSGVWDTEAVTQHPEWARVNEKGEADKEKTSTVGEYADRHLIPQLKELTDTYRIDGAWVDGECWAIVPDYSPRMLELFTKETGIATIPKTKQEPHYQAFADFNRKKFRQYVAHYVDELHRHNKDFQITSNWAFSSMMPEKVDVNLDFLSGDLSANNSVNSAAFQARCLALQGKPWDLMAWSFSRGWTKEKDGVHTDKSLTQLQQEAAEVMAMGGGFQSYWTQNGDASVRPYTFKRMSQLAEFCRARQKFCHKAEIMPQIGLLYPASAWKKVAPSLYTDGGTQAMQGILTLLMDAQQSVEILMEHHLEGRLANYPLLIVPEWVNMDAKVKTQLLDYARNGGNLLIIGGLAVKDFENELGVTFLGKATELGNYQNYIGFGDRMAGIKGWFQSVRLKSGTESVGVVSKSNDFRFAQWPFVSVAAYGKGKIAGVYADIGDSYNQFQAPVCKAMVKATVEKLMPNPVTRISGSGYVHTVVAKKDGKLTIHLMNTAGMHSNRDVYAYDEVPPLQNLTVQIRTGTKPAKIVSQPEAKPLPFVYDKGVVTVKIPRLEIHTMLVVEQ